MANNVASVGRVFVVDDQDSILASVAAVLGDEAYDVTTFSSAEALEVGLRNEVPDLILLDIWLPGIDGLEALKQLKVRYNSTPVILMSGHAGVDVAVKGMQYGAADFLEKPLNLDTLLEKIALHLPKSLNHRDKAESHKGNTLKRSDSNAVCIEKGKAIQKTVKTHAVLNGVGLLSGKPTGIIITPASINTGIVFKTFDGVEIPAHITSLENFNSMASSKAFTANSTVLAKNLRQVRTVEHLLAALHMLGITNALIKVDGEIPNVDGSAVDYCKIIAQAGIVEQGESVREIVIKEKIGLGEEILSEKHLYAEPFDGFEVELRVDYPAPIGEQKYKFNPCKHDFTKEIAPARSFNTFENIDMAQQSGMVGSGYLNSHIIIHDGKVINTKLNFPDEFVRHKILDLLGDIYLLGLPLRGRLVGNMTSHGINQALALKIFQALPEN